MEEFVYEESDYINPKEYKYFIDLWEEHDFDLTQIEDEVEFNIVKQYLFNLTEKAVNFLPAYEQALIILSSVESNGSHRELMSDLEDRWLKACERIAKKEDIFNKEVLWGFMENRPLIRGLYNGAQKMWDKGDFDGAHELFSKILKTNEDDNIGARYSVKATEQKMKFSEFEKKFTYTDEDGYSIYKPELEEWFTAS